MRPDLRGRGRSAGAAPAVIAVVFLLSLLVASCSRNEVAGPGAVTRVTMSIRLGSAARGAVAARASAAARTVPGAPLRSRVSRLR